MAMQYIFKSFAFRAALLVSLTTSATEMPIVHSRYTNPVFPAATNGAPYVAHGVAGGVAGLQLTAANSNAYETSTAPKLTFVALGSPACAMDANCSLGDVLIPPPGWLEGSEPVSIIGSNLTWITYAHILLATDSGTGTVTWRLVGERTRTVVYTVSPSPLRRPVRLYWTDDATGKPLQNAGPVVQFGQNYRVDLYYNAEIKGNPSNPQWTYPGAGSTNTPPDVWLDGTVLHAKAGARGEFLVTYSRIDSDTGLQMLLDYEVVEVLEPMSSLQVAHVGDRLKPLQRQYEIDDLFCLISRGAVDDTGERPEDIFVHKHLGGAKNGWVWAIRETTSPWQIEIYWKAKEKLDVIWPFEVDIYSVTWGTEMQKYVRGDVEAGQLEPYVYIPSDLHVEPMRYQTRSGESGASAAFAFVADGKLHTTALGKFLLKYATETDIWFEPVEAVSHSALVGSAIDQEIASEVRPTDETTYGEWPGYLYQSSGMAFNSGAYAYPTKYAAPADIDSKIFGVNRGNLEVWWANASQYWTMQGVSPDEIQLPFPLYFPSAATLYTNVWPSHANEIVVASGRGSLGLTQGTNGVCALVCDGTGFEANDWQEGHFSTTDPFTLEAWVNPADTNGTLFEKGSSWSFGLTNGLLVMQIGSTPFLSTAALSLGKWQHVAMVHDASGTIHFYIDGSRAGSSHSLPPLARTMDKLRIGEFTGLLDEVRIWDTARSAAQIREHARLPILGVDPTLDYYATFDLGELFPDYNLAACVPGGRPSARPGMSLAGASPRLYRQDDPTAAGYNPNEEHALILGDEVFALRNDYNVTNGLAYTSEPYVLLNITEPDGTPNMAIFKVIMENELYPFQQNLDAGIMLQAISPLNRLAPTWCEENSFVSGYLTPFEDRNGRFWAHQAGDDGGNTNIVAHFFYPVQEGFWFPKGHEQLIGSHIPLTVNDGQTPLDYSYIISWPEDVPGLYVGDTLTEPKDGLPAIRGQLSVAVPYQQSLALDPTKPSVVLIDPTLVRKAPLTEAPGGMKFYRDPKTGFTFFSELPPDLRDRLYWNPTAEEAERFQLIGDYREREDGFNYLLLNVLKGTNRVSVADASIVTGQDGDWKTAIASLPESVVTIPDDTTPFDSLALSTSGHGSGYVTLVFNNSTRHDMVDPSQVVSMAIIRVEPELFVGKLDTILSSNPLDKQVTLHYTADFAGEPERYAFEWEYAEPDNGAAPKTNSEAWLSYRTETAGLLGTTVGDAGVFGLSDHYIRCRYRALDSEIQSVVGTNWTAWTPPQLCEGWIKRVLKAINPFEQRIRDYLNHAIETDLSMIQQAGKPYNGDVPLNLDALNEYGLIPIYQTVLEQSRNLSIDANIDAQGSLALALLMVSGRLADLYTILGNEAYADALNPTVTLGSNDPVDATEVSSIFCFQNQLPNLLAEELALLRGRDATLNPSVGDYPLYNRLAWNFTADIVGGEVAYALNYGISDAKGNQDGSINAQDAEILFPQGHGDAWGHYLTAIKNYYTLMNHPNFGWLPQVEGLLVDSTEVTTSYLHEKKFAHAAAAKARAGVDILDKTYRQSYTEGADNQWNGLRDSDTNRCWGVEEWGAKVGQSTYFDWLAGNSLLPSSDEDPAHEGIRVMDRQTTPELDEIAVAGQRVQQTMDRVNANLNPLGLAPNVVPFDISAAGIDAGETHFEQIYARAVAALRNAVSIFDRVQNCAQALRDQNESDAFDTSVADEEAAMERRLIEIYGYPYSDDIGSGKLYPQGYTGPDLEHYLYIEQYTSADVNYTRDISYVITNRSVTGTEMKDMHVNLPLAVLTWPVLKLASNAKIQVPVVSKTSRTVTFRVGPGGVPVKPASYQGTRRAEGEIQLALSTYLEALNRVNAAAADCQLVNTSITNAYDRLVAEHTFNTVTSSYNSSVNGMITAIKKIMGWCGATQSILEMTQKDFTEMLKNIGDAAPKAVGMANDVGATARVSTSGSASVFNKVMNAIKTALKDINTYRDILIAEIEFERGSVIGKLTLDYQLEKDLWAFTDLVSTFNGHYLAYIETLQAAETARMAFQKTVAAGDAVLVERERLRTHQAADLNSQRYRNMAYQIFRNDELQRYNEAFDQAARYCYLAAKAFDYETGLLASDSQHMTGRDFMNQIVKARTLGRMTRGTGNVPDEPLVGASAGDPGLADILARMKANWDVLDGRLSFNNPQRETGRFSLRSELLRICPHGTNTVASDENWRKALESFRVDNLLNLPEFKRYCLPFTPAEAVEPALVIPFSTTIEFRKNFFGQELAGGDNAYDSTHFATKIRSVGVWFSNFNTALNGVANQPRVYLIPVGIDRMRVPSDNLDEVRSWQVADQALPVPYPFNEQLWGSPDWSMLKDGLGSELFSIRKYPSLRAYHDSGNFSPAEVISNSRLVGRSVWNSKWLLIIPGGTLLADGDEGLARLIHGVETSPGVRNEAGIDDIKIFFETYSYSGN
jgi:Concanavalin A-like lectin/glucanases superfamily